MINCRNNRINENKSRLMEFANLLVVTSLGEVVRNVSQFLAYSTQVNLWDENKSRAYEVQCNPLIRLVFLKNYLPLSPGPWCHNWL